MQTLLNLVLENTELKNKPEILKLIYGTESNSIIETGVVGLYITRIYPNAWEGIGWRDQDPEKRFVSLSSEEKDEVESQIFTWIKNNLLQGGQVLRMGHSFYECDGLQKDIYKLLNIPKSKQHRFGAVTVKKDDFVILAYDDKTGGDEIHELHHLKPGLAVGSLGYGIDEGMTEHFAILEDARKYAGTLWNHVWVDRQNDLFAVQGRFPTYLDERKLLSVITDNGRNLAYTLLENRYKNGDTESSLELAAYLINQFGLKGYLQLYLASPGIDKKYRGPLLPSSKVIDLLA